MEKTSVNLSALIARCRAWSREAEAIWPRLHTFVEHVGDFLRVREAGGWIPQELPEDSRVVSELAYWQVQQVLGMGVAQVCDNTVVIARFCQAFLFAGELDPHALSPESRRVFEALLEYTQQLETVLLASPCGDAKSRRLELLVHAIHRSCDRYPVIPEHGNWLIERRKTGRTAGCCS